MSSSPRRVLRNVVMDSGLTADGAPGQTPRVLRSSAIDFPGDAASNNGDHGRVLRQVGGVDAPTIQPEQRAADLEERAYQRGLEDGRQSARQQLESASAALQSALTRGREQLREEFAGQQEELVGLAVDMATQILGHNNHDGGEALRQRLLEALARLDDDQMVIAMNEVDLPLAEGIEAAGIVFVPDPDLSPGEAKITGQWAQADLTHKTAQQILRDQVLT